MADKKITQLTQHVSVINSDLLPVVDITATETKKLAVGTLRDFINQGLISSSAQLDLSNFAIISGGNNFIGDQQINGYLQTTDYISTDNVVYTNFIEENLTNGGINFVAGGNGFSFTNNVEITGSVNATNFTGSLFGTASTSNELFVNESTANLNYKLLFTTTGVGNKNVLQDSGTDGTYNPWTNTLTATNLAGTATNATNVNIATNSTNTNYYVTFGFGSGNNRVTIDGGGQFTYNPSTNLLTVPNVTATTGLIAPLQNGYMWVGNSSGVNQQITTSSFITPAQTGSFVESAYLSIYSTGSQPLLVSGAAQPVTFTSEWASQGVYLSGSSYIVFEKAGVYEFNFVAQVTNAENAVYDSWFWIKYNGNNFPNSTTQLTLQPRKNINLPSAQLMSMSIIGVALNDNDYIELYWTGENTFTALTETSATGVIPETPSIIASIKKIG